MKVVGKKGLGQIDMGAAVVLFLSTFLNKVDKKGRVSVPAAYRTALMHQSFPGVVVFPSLQHPSIEGSGIDRFERLADGIDDLNPFSDAHDDFSKAIFGQTQQLLKLLRPISNWPSTNLGEANNRLPFRPRHQQKEFLLQIQTTFYQG